MVRRGSCNGHAGSWRSPRLCWLPTSPSMRPAGSSAGPLGVDPGRHCPRVHRPCGHVGLVRLRRTRGPSTRLSTRSQAWTSHRSGSRAESRTLAMSVSADIPNGRVPGRHSRGQESAPSPLLRLAIVLIGAAVLGTCDLGELHPLAGIALVLSSRRALPPAHDPRPLSPLPAIPRIGGHDDQS